MGLKKKTASRPTMYSTFGCLASSACVMASATFWGFELSTLVRCFKLLKTERESKDIIGGFTQVSELWPFFSLVLH